VYNIEQIINKLINATDSDDVQSIAIFIEYNISKEEQSRLKKMLKEYSCKNAESTVQALSIKQLLDFLE